MVKKNIFPSLAILGICFIVLSQVAFGQNKEITAILQSKLDSLTSNRIVPGVTLAVLYKDDTCISIASGFADVEENINMKPDDVMFSGSVGKTYVAAVVLKLYEQGNIDIKAKAITYLKDEPWFLKVPNARDMTIEMLLNHTAGIPEYVYNKDIWAYVKQNPDKVWTVEERLAYIFNKPPTNAPGEGWAYADAHYLVLGLIIEKVTKKTYYEVLDELILKPCKLNHTFHADKRELPGLVAGYTALTEDFLLPHKVLQDHKYAFNPQLEWTGGGLVTTVSDLASWVKQLYGGNVLKEETKKLMLTPAPFETTLFEKAKYGLGCFIGETNGILYYGHTGFVPGYITYVQYIPSCNIAIALQFNDDSSHRNFSIKTFFNSLKTLVIEDYKKEIK